MPYSGTIQYPNDSGAEDLGLPRDRSATIDMPRRSAPTRFDYGNGEAVPYATFKGRHPEHLAETWARCRAFYRGGAALLNNHALLADVFPQHLAEKPHVYEERKRRAFYINYAGAIVDWFVSALAADPVRMGVEDEDKAEENPADALVLPDDYWEDFFEDVSRPGGEAMDFQECMLHCLRTAQQCGRSWILVDLPELRQDAPPPANLAEQEERGELDAYLVHVEPEEVIDWHAEESGELVWAIRRTCDAPRADWRQARGQVVERFTVYERAGWMVYEIRYPKNETPDDNAKVFKVAEGTHSFGRVPLLPFVLPEGLWTMGKLESPARAHFNKRNALDWAEHKSLLPILYEFLAPEFPVGGGAEDPNRAVNQPRGQGYVQVRAAGDDAKYVGPDPAPFKSALESCHDLRDEMHRVTHAMALAVNNSGAALARSAESKGQDKADRTIVLEEFGRLLRDFALRVVSTVGAGRGDASDEEWQARGWESFDLDSLGELIDQAVNLSVVSIPSPTFQRLHLADLAQKRLGEKATPAVMEAIENELEQALAAETMVKEATDEATMAMANAAADGAGQEDDGEDEGDAPKGRPVAPPPPGKRQAFSSKG